MRSGRSSRRIQSGAGREASWAPTCVASARTPTINRIANEVLRIIRVSPVTYATEGTEITDSHRETEQRRTNGGFRRVGPAKQATHVAGNRGGHESVRV